MSECLADDILLLKIQAGLLVQAAGKNNSDPLFAIIEDGKLKIVKDDREMKSFVMSMILEALFSR